MSTFFDAVITKAFLEEGGYSNDKDDVETDWGVTVTEARAHGYVGPMKDMPKSWAFSFYKQVYVIDPQLDILASQDRPLAERLCDAGINCGVETACAWPQRALNVLRFPDPDSPPLFPLLKVDGRFGPMSRYALRLYYASRKTGEGASVVLFNTICQHGMRYLEITEANPRKQKFINGWDLQRAMSGLTLPTSSDTATA